MLDGTIKKTKLGIVGSRRRNSKKDFDAIMKAIHDYAMWNVMDNIILVSGGCPKGADKFAEMIAKEFGMTIMIHYPNWKGHGRFAGLKRNTKIAKDIDVLIACPASDRTGGTEDTIKKARKLGKKIILI